MNDILRIILAFIIILGTNGLWILALIFAINTSYIYAYLLFVVCVLLAVKNTYYGFLLLFG